MRSGGPIINGADRARMEADIRTAQKDATLQRELTTRRTAQNEPGGRKPTIGGGA
jgi:hypothetical protein